jgi:signal transduction histidine kinase
MFRSNADYSAGLKNLLRLTQRAIEDPQLEMQFWHNQQHLAALYTSIAAAIAAVAYACMTVWQAVSPTPLMQTSDWFFVIRALLVAVMCVSAWVLSKDSFSLTIRSTLVCAVFAMFAFLPAVLGPFRLAQMNVYQGLSALVGTIMLGAVVIRIPWSIFACIALAATLAYTVVLHNWSGVFMDQALLIPMTERLPGVMFVQLFIIVAVALIVHRLIELRERRLFLQKIEIEALSNQRLGLLEALGHDLQQPLAALNLQSGVAVAAMRQGRFAEAEMMLAQAERTVNWVREELEQLTDASCLADCRFRPVLQPCFVQDLVAPVVATLACVALEKGLTLQHIQLDGAHYCVTTNPDLFRRILSNLITNAINYGAPVDKEATRMATIEVVIEPSVDEQFVRVRVVDHGQGIAQNELIKIWQPMFRGSNVSPGSQPGHGFGLSMVKAAVDSMPGHSVRVSSELKKGATFELSVPISRIGMPNSMQQPY